MRRVGIELGPGLGAVLVVVGRDMADAAFLPAQPHGDADQHVHHQPAAEPQLGVGAEDVAQGQQRLDGELAVLGRLDLLEQLFDLQREAAFAGRAVGPGQRAVEPVAGVELVADDEARHLPQQAPDALVEVAGHAGQHARQLAPGQPAGHVVGQRRVVRGREVHRHQRRLAVAALMHLQRLQAHQVAAHLLLAGDDLAQPRQQGLRAAVEQVVEGLGLADGVFQRQPAGDQQQQVPRPQRQRALEQARVGLDHGAQQQHEFLDQQPRPDIVPAEAAQALEQLGMAQR
ncbi:MAG: hypothetical protein RLZZ524_2757, partial [Pseudomonadota bacterium]